MAAMMVMMIGKSESLEEEQQMIKLLVQAKEQLR
jgi:hypothetical protein